MPCSRRCDIFAAVAFKIGLVQMRCTDDARENQAAAEDGIRRAARQGAKIVCLPELYRSRYFCQSEDHANFALAEAIPGPSTKALGALAKSLKIAIVGSLFERAPRGLPQHRGGPRRRRPPRRHVSQDAHPRRSAVLREILFHAGRPRLPGLRHEARPHRHARLLGPVVPRGGPAHRAAGRGVLFYPTAIGWHPSEKAQWGEEQISAPGRPSSVRTPSPTASTSRRSTASATRVRRPAGIEFFGASFICDPYGRMIVAEASRDKPELLVAEVDPKIVETARQHWPFLRDRRIDAYGGITERSLEKK